MIAQWFLENQSKFDGKLGFAVPLRDHTYYRIGGPAQVFCVPRSLEDLKRLSEGIRETKIRFFILGSGSNVLAPDEGFSGLVIRTHRLNLKIEEIEASFGRGIVTGASVAVSSLLNRAEGEGWAGLEFLTGVPGSIGGVVWMNAGTHLGEAKDRLMEVRAFDLNNPSELLQFAIQDLKFEYRKNLFLKQGLVVWDATWWIDMDSPETIRARIGDILKRRKSTQPLDLPSCGSVFKNPNGNPAQKAWQVIDQLKLRGHQIGGAKFSEKHSNFIVNLGEAKANDVRALIDLAKTRALTELGISLEEEVIYMGS